MVNQMTSMQKPRSFAIAQLHISGLAILAVSQPLFELLARNPTFLVAHGSAGVWLVLAGLLLLIIVPSIAILLVALVAVVSSRAAQVLHLVLFGLLAAALAIQPIHHSGLAAIAQIAVALAVGAGVAAAYAFFQPVRSFATLVALGSLLCPVIFFSNESIWSLVRSSGSSACASAASVNAVAREPVPVVLVVFDEFPVLSIMDDKWEIDAERFPHLAGLGATSDWFSNATSVSVATHQAVPAILDGLYPDRSGSGLPNCEGHPRNLFTMLETTHRMSVFENVTDMNPDRPVKGPADRWDDLRQLGRDLTVVYLHILAPPELAARYLPFITESWKDFGRREGVDGDAARRHSRASRRTAKKRSRPQKNRSAFPVDRSDRHAAFDDFVSSIEPTSRPGLYFLHSMLPHSNWTYAPSGRRYTLSEPGIRGVIGPNHEGLPTNQWLEDPWFSFQAQQRHLLQVTFVDELVGQLVRRLKEQNLFDESLVIITSDHGAAFEPGTSRRSVGDVTYPDVMLVPLLVKRPYQRAGRVRGENVEIIDILPTIADLLDVPLDWDFDGQSLAGDEIAERPHKRIVAARLGPLDFPGVLPRAQQRLDVRLNRFPPGPVEGLYTVGPHPSLLGRALEELPHSTGQGPRAALDGEAFLQNVDLESDFVLSNISGSLPDVTAPTEPVHIAVAVNGIVRATTRTVVRWGRVEFAAPVPESALLAGANRVDLFEILDVAGTPTLRSLPRQAESYSLTRTNGKAVLEDPQGRQISAAAGGLRGRALGLVRSEDRSVAIQGWAADPARGELPSAVLLFVGGDLLRVAHPRYARPEVSERYGKPELLRSGFLFELPYSSGVDPGSSDIRIFAISAAGDVASEIRYSGKE